MVYVVQLRGVGEPGVAAAGGNGLEGAGKSEPSPGGFGCGGELFEEGLGVGGLTGEQVLGNGQGQAARTAVVLPAVPTVGEVEIPGLGPGAGGGVAGVFLDVGQDGLGFPPLGGVAEGRVAVDGRATE
uniref:Uncharacterized protein n=1 Tax=Candidatus Kentrum eta TaxID=2126337 RepID=A0A450VL23_9GAMM|nr:MAG: hypothetical protein BECKH772A_GA0070896_102834 [Candidatus Kentron sp. H]VFK02808.1 MAG: hypothetical protein BECKH772B_GA0070898_103054 [Candidatus Kentron sp. H]VFK05451.1 MAG: hypothetical protein BECKH772C_GA0070978_102734 [Candidatus Kentron sp. H]